MKLNKIVNIINGSTPSTSNPSFWDGDIYWITPKDMSLLRSRYISRGNRNISKLGYGSCSTTLVPAGTVLLTSRAPIGYVAIANNPLCTNQGFKSMVCNESFIKPQYLYYWIFKNKEYLESIAGGSTFKELSKEQLGNIDIELPSLNIQQHIVNTIGSLDSLIENYDNQISKLLNILEISLSDKSLVPLEYYKPYIVKSGIKKYNNTKNYLDTSSVEGINNILEFDSFSFEKRPSRANMEPLVNSIWFAKMKGSKKVIIVTNNDKDLLNDYIFSTGYLGIKATDKLPLSFLVATISSPNFFVQRDLNSVGTIMAGINNETFNKIMVPKLSDDEIKDFDKTYSPLVKRLASYRRKIIKLKELKNLLLRKYF